MQELPKVKIAVIGTGVIGPRHAQAVQRESNAELTCIVDPSPAAEAVATSLGVPIYPDVGTMLRSKHCDAAIVCTPNHTHVKVSLELLAGGVHVLVEKPISTDVESAKQLISHASGHNLHLLVGHHRRFHSYVRATKSLLEASSLGRVIAVSGIWATLKPDSYFDEPAAWRRSAASGGPILINLIHDVDILQYFFGPIIRVHAEGTTKQRNFEVEEGAAIVLRFESGIVGTFVLCDAAASPWTFEQGTGENPLFPQSGQGFLRLLGSKASLSVGDMKRWSYGGTGEQNWEHLMSAEDVPVKDEVPFELQVSHLVQVVRGKELPVCSGADGLRALVVCNAIKRSLETGGPVSVEQVH